MTISDRLRQIVDLSNDLATMVKELHEEIDEAINDPSWVLPAEVIEEKNDTENSTIEDTSGEKGGES